MLVQWARVAVLFYCAHFFFFLVILLLTVTEKGKLDINGLIYQGKKFFYSLMCAHDEDALDFNLNLPSIFSFSMFLIFYLSFSSILEWLWFFGVFFCHFLLSLLFCSILLKSCQAMLQFCLNSSVFQDENRTPAFPM